MCHQDILNTARTYEASLQVAVEPEPLHQMWPPPQKSNLVRTHAEALPFLRATLHNIQHVGLSPFWPKEPIAHSPRGGSHTFEIHHGPLVSETLAFLEFLDN